MVVYLTPGQEPYRRSPAGAFAFHMGVFCGLERGLTYKILNRGMGFSDAAVTRCLVTPLVLQNS